MSTADAAPSNQEQRDDRTPEEIATYWQIQLELAEKHHNEWWKDGAKVTERYKSEKKSAAQRSGRTFNILYSNTEVLRSALYGKTAKPDVRRRFADQDPVARQAAEIVERALIDCNETYDSDKAIEQGIQDYLLPGRAVIRVEYEPVIKTRPKLDPMTAQPIEGQTEEFIAEQQLRECYVYWRDFLHQPARNWESVQWEAFRSLMSRAELKELMDTKPEGSQAPAALADIPLNWSPTMHGSTKEPPSNLKKAEVWQVWDKEKRQRLFIVKGYKLPIRIDQDPYGLEDFFPNAEPLSAYTTNDDLIPEPEFYAYRDQADELDEIVNRISKLTRALKRRGVYDQAVKELQRLQGAGDNVFLPVENYAALTQKGGLAAAFQSEDIKPIAEVLDKLYVQRDMLVQAIYEVTGISDIIRGATDPDETLGAQKLKGQFGSMRMKRRQRAVQKWIRDTLKLKAEIIAEHFEPQVLQQMTGQQITPEVMDLLRSDKLRSYRIDVETDSTVFEDAEAEKQATVEMLTAVGGFLEKGMMVAGQQPLMIPLLFEMLEVGVRHFKQGRQIEDVIEQTKQQLLQAAQQPKPPGPEEVKAQADAKAKEADIAHNQQKHEQGMQFRQQEHEQKMQLGREQMAQEAERQKMKEAQKQFEIANGQDVERYKIDKDAEVRREDIKARRDEGEATRRAQKEEGGAGRQLQREEIGTERAIEQIISGIKDMQTEKSKEGERKEDAATVQALERLSELIEHSTKPRRIRMSNGKEAVSEIIG